jgi:hypothetical protein
LKKSLQVANYTGTKGIGLSAQTTPDKFGKALYEWLNQNLKNQSIHFVFSGAGGLNIGFPHDAEKL